MLFSSQPFAAYAITPLDKNRAPFSGKGHIFHLDSHVVLRELITGEMPVQNTKVSTQQAYANVQRGQRPDIKPTEERAGPWVAYLTQACWEQDPENRPTIIQNTMTLQSRDGVAIV